MAIPPLSAPATAPSAASAITKSTAAEKAHKLHHAAEQFEGILINTLWSGFQNDPMTAPEDSDPGAGSMRSMGLQAMSTALAASGGLGLAAMIERQLTPHTSTPPAAGKSHLAPLKFGGTMADKAPETEAHTAPSPAAGGVGGGTV